MVRRCKELGIRHLHQGIEDKPQVLAQLLALLDISARRCACIGDDLPDLPLLAQAGFAVAVADAHPAALAIAHRCTRLPGGGGAVHEVCDWLLSARRDSGRT